MLRFPSPDEKIVCHVRFPNASAMLAVHEDTSEGMSHIAAEMQRVAERFDNLSMFLEECSDMSYKTGTHFVDGNQVFIFEVPRRYRASLLSMGFEEDEVDV